MIQPQVLYSQANVLMTIKPAALFTFPVYAFLHIVTLHC